MIDVGGELAALTKRIRSLEAAVAAMARPGTVTDAGPPVRVLLDGDLSDTPMADCNAAYSPGEGHRVRVVLFGNRLVVEGRYPTGEGA